MLKLGPRLIGRGKRRFFERMASRGIGGIVLRMRVRDLCRCQADAWSAVLQKFPGKELCIINIAGGAASDSINTLILIQQENPALLKSRKIEIDVLDIDSFGPDFAANCISELKKPGQRFHGIDISLSHIHYDWANTDTLASLISERKGWIQFCSSEGGIFEYCSDEVIMRNLDTLYRNSSVNIVSGSLLHDIDSIDAGIIASLKILTGIKPRFLGIDGLKRVCENKWAINSLIKGNPRYLVFSLARSGMK
jgi:hypothetical protein